MVLLLYSPTSTRDGSVVSVVEAALRKRNVDFYVDRRSDADMHRAQLMADWVGQADHVVAFISKEAESSEALEFELECVVAERRRGRKPALITVKVGTEDDIVGPVGAYVLDESTITWESPDDNDRVAASVMEALSMPALEAELTLEPVGKAAFSTRFYTLRPSDEELDSALRAGESVVLIRGPRQVGKTSLIGRGAELVNELGWRQVSTDFQKLNAFQLNDVDKFCQLLAKTIARQLDFSYDFESNWAEDFGPNLNLDHFMRAALNHSGGRLVWFMDEADRIFATPLASDFYGLVRSWHNARATDPKGPWSRFTVVIGYATEARLFIQDLNQSPFNVGRHITLDNFTLAQTTDLNVRFGGPLKRRSDLEGMQFLLGGQPMLTSRDRTPRQRHDQLLRARRDGGQRRRSIR